MDRLEAIRAFVTVVEANGFAPAARRMGWSAPAVTRAIAALEQHVGARLLHRTTRALRVTESGGRFFEACKRTLAELEEAEREAGGSHREPRGQLSITAPVLFGRMHVAPIVLEFMAQYPQLSARMVFVDHVVDMIEEGIDVAVRIGSLPESSLRARRVGSVRRVVCASPEYLAAHGTPHKPSDLASHSLIGFAGLTPHRHWTFQHRGKQQTIIRAPRLLVNGAEIAIAAAVAGHGITRVLSYQVASAVRAGQLTIVLADHEPPASPIHILHGDGQHASARVRAFVDLCVKRLRVPKPADRLILP